MTKKNQRKRPSKKRPSKKRSSKKPLTKAKAKRILKKAKQAATGTRGRKSSRGVETLSAEKMRRMFADMGFPDIEVRVINA